MSDILILTPAHDKKLEHPDLYTNTGYYEALDYLERFMKINKFSYRRGEKGRQYAIVLLEALRAATPRPADYGRSWNEDNE